MISENELKLDDNTAADASDSSSDAGAGGNAGGNGDGGRPRQGNRRGRNRRRGRGGKPRNDAQKSARRDTEADATVSDDTPQKVGPTGDADTNTKENADVQPTGGRTRPQPDRRKGPQGQGQSQGQGQGQSQRQPHSSGYTFGQNGQTVIGTPDSEFGNFGIALSNAESDNLDSMPPDPTLDAVFADLPPKRELAPDEGTEIVGIRFGHGGKVYYFAPAGFTFHYGDHAVVETSRGVEFGDVAIPNRRVPDSEIVQPLRAVLRRATPADITHNEDNHNREDDAFRVCIGKIEAHKLEMKLVGAQYTFDNSKLIFYFTSSGRVDFRDLVKDLASVFRTRIELRQIGIRDEAKMIGGWGVCGRKLCCANFLPNFAQVSIRMAKEQGLSLNSTKISGVCGRLMCCLRFEQESYEREIADMPPVDSIVKTADGKGVIIEIHPMAGNVRVKITDKADVPPSNYKLSDITVITRAPARRVPGADGIVPTATAVSDTGNGRNGGRGRRNGAGTHTDAVGAADAAAPAEAADNDTQAPDAGIAAADTVDIAVNGDKN